MKRTGVGFLIVLGIVASLGTAWSASELKIGYVNLQMALNKSLAGGEAKRIFEQDKKKKQEELTLKEEEFKRLEEDLQKKSMLLNKEAVEKKGGELENEKLKLQQFFRQAEEELRRREALLTRKIIGDLEVVVKELAREKGYTFVFERMEGGIIYAPEGEDLTNEAIKIYDELFIENKKKQDISVPTK
ncbi:MAG: OmpH family outer membrane protein [Thermodesulfobacteriota bacterium]